MARTQLSKREERIVSPTEKRERKIDFSLLSEEDKAKITEEARRLLEAEDRAAAVAEFLKAEKRRLELEAHPEVEEEKVEVSINLPDWANPITIDGRAFHHGWTVKVRHSVAQVLEESMFRAQLHDDEVAGRNERVRNWKRSLMSLEGRGTRIGVDGSVTQTHPRF